MLTASKSTIEIIRECMRFAKPRTAVEIADLLSLLQVQDARLVELAAKAKNGELATDYEIQRRMLDAADLYTLASRLFPYARRSPDSARPKVASEDRATVLRIADLNDAEYPDLFK